jgi:hypothetical protein
MSCGQCAAQARGAIAPGVPGDMAANPPAARGKRPRLSAVQRQALAYLRDNDICNWGLPAFYPVPKGTTDGEKAVQYIKQHCADGDRLRDVRPQTLDALQRRGLVAYRLLPGRAGSFGQIIALTTEGEAALDEQ